MYLAVAFLVLVLVLVLVIEISEYNYVTHQDILEDYSPKEWRARIP